MMYSATLLVSLLASAHGFASKTGSGPPKDETVAPASFWPTPIEDLGPCEAPFDDDAVLRAARLQNALIFVNTPFQIDAWVASDGTSFAQSETTSLLESITTPNVKQVVYETGAWSGTSKFVEYQAPDRSPYYSSLSP